MCERCEGCYLDARCRCEAAQHALLPAAPASSGAQDQERLPAEAAAVSAVMTHPQWQPTEGMPQPTFHDIPVALLHLVPALLKLLFQGLPDALHSWRKGKQHLQQGCAFRHARPDMPQGAVHCLHDRRLELLCILLRGRCHLWQGSVAGCGRHVLLRSKMACHRRLPRHMTCRHGLVDRPHASSSPVQVCACLPASERPRRWASASCSHAWPDRSDNLEMRT